MKNFEYHLSSAPFAKDYNVKDPNKYLNRVNVTTEEDTSHLLPEEIKDKFETGNHEKYKIISNKRKYESMVGYDELNKIKNDPRLDTVPGNKMIVQQNGHYIVQMPTRIRGDANPKPHRKLLLPYKKPPTLQLINPPDEQNFKQMIKVHYKARQLIRDNFNRQLFQENSTPWDPNELHGTVTTDAAYALYTRPENRVKQDQRLVSTKQDIPYATTWVPSGPDNSQRVSTGLRPRDFFKIPDKLVPIKFNGIKDPTGKHSSTYFEPQAKLNYLNADFNKQKFNIQGYENFGSRNINNAYAPLVLSNESHGHVHNLLSDKNEKIADGYILQSSLIPNYNPITSRNLSKETLPQLSKNIKGKVIQSHHPRNMTGSHIATNSGSVALAPKIATDVYKVQKSGSLNRPGIVSLNRMFLKQT